MPVLALAKADQLRLTVSARNDIGMATPMRLSRLRQAAGFRVDTSVVEDCLDVSAAPDVLFAKGWRTGPSALTSSERRPVAGDTGHVAESVTEVLLDRLGWRALWHFHRVRTAWRRPCVPGAR
jgi:hypothetical protein